MTSQSLIYRKTIFSGITDQSIIIAYQNYVASQSIDATANSDGTNNYITDVNGNIVYQGMGVRSIATIANDANIAAYINANFTSITYTSYSYTINYGV